MQDKATAFIASLPKKTVDTNSGPVAGYILNGVAVFKGIPYAAPPVNNLRWRPPEPPLTWKEPLDATRSGNACPQDITQFPVFEKMGEDCLLLNIWAPEKPGPGLCPVMVWLHGGGFGMGSGSMPVYDGTYFATIGVVVVTINYRLGAMGFLAHPELSLESPYGSSGNYGLMDQVFALQWVKDNISRFGGDPKNVTIFGESAGGASVVALMASPLSKGLFHRAIAQSCGNAPAHLRKLSESNAGLECAESLGLRFAGALGLEEKKGALQKLRQIPVNDLVSTWFKTVQHDPTGSGVTGAWQLNHLIVDGQVLQESPSEVFRTGNQHGVPFIIGTVADEGTMFQLFLFMGPPDLSRYRLFVEKAFGKAKDRVLEEYKAGDDQEAGAAACDILGSGFFCGARRLARSMSAVQPLTFRYLFSMPPKFFLYQIPGIPDWKKHFRCFHAAEIPFVFHFMSLPGYEEEDRALADQVAGYWARFARTGNPNGDGAPHWPMYSQQNEEYIILDNPVRTGRGYQEKGCDFAEEIEKAGV